jgi:DNA-binding HxlR family transcriptional regulator
LFNASDFRGNLLSMPRAKARERRSACPISAALEVLGDRWSLLVIRDLMLRESRSYRDFLTSGEGIATNILAARLRHLAATGLITSGSDPADRRRRIYRLTPKGMDLGPVLLELGRWGVRHEKIGKPHADDQRWKADRDALVAAVRQRARPGRDGPGRTPRRIGGAGGQ